MNTRPAHERGGGERKPEPLTRASVELLVELFGRTGYTNRDARIDRELRPATPPKIPAYVHLEQSDIGRRLLASLAPGDRGPLTRIPRVRVEHIPETLLELLSHPGVRAMTLIEQLRPSIHYAAAACCLPELKDANHTGRGVFIGIIDSGIDPSHPMFDQRIAAVWDQTDPGPASGNVPYGRVLTGAQVNNTTDTTGHGTHVAGIAAGADPKHGGVADGATLVIVKSRLTDDDIEAALYWLKDFADQAGRPMVVNLSCEASFDPHDGSGTVCEAIDDVSGPGFIVCCASGNAGMTPSHAETSISPGKSVQLPFTVIDASGPTPLRLKGWADPQAKLAVGIISPGGTQWLPPSAPAPGALPLWSNTLHGTHIDIGWPKAEPPFNGATGFLVSLQQQPGADARGTWKLVLLNQGTSAEQVHVWSYSADAVQFEGAAATDRYKIAAPGAAGKAITVGAFVTRVAWRDDTGEKRIHPGTRFQVDPSSSPGPLRSSQEKPDLVAPGAYICSARSSNARVPDGYGVSPRHRIMSGTSMATPFIAGVVALMLEADHGLTPEDAKAHLKAISSVPGGAAGGFDPHWGYGLPDLALLSFF